MLSDRMTPDAMTRVQTRMAVYGKVMAEVQPKLAEVNRIAGDHLRRVCDDMAHAQAAAAEAGRDAFGQLLSELTDAPAETDHVTTPRSE